MLADPFGRRLRAGDMLPQAVKLGQPERRVRYLVEVCDPAEAGDFAYQVNGVLVSDFTRRISSIRSPSAACYSFTGAIKAPRTVLKDGVHQLARHGHRPLDAVAHVFPMTSPPNRRTSSI